MSNSAGAKFRDLVDLAYPDRKQLPRSMMWAVVLLVASFGTLSAATVLLKLGAPPVVFFALFSGSVFLFFLFATFTSGIILRSLSPMLKL